LIVYLALAPQFVLSWKSLLIVVLISVISMLVEAVSPHGWDNATMQVVPALLGSVLL